ncbi:unnamed protein product [Penicillium bialowiezense]
MPDKRENLGAKEFEIGLAELDKEMSQNPWIVAFAPIQLITAGGFLAVAYLKSRESTGDIDFLFDTEFASDKDIQKGFRECAAAVAQRLRYNTDWINNSMSIFVTAKARE